MHPCIKIRSLFYLINDVLVQQVTQGKNIPRVFRKIYFLFKYYRRNFEFDTK